MNQIHQVVDDCVDSVLRNDNALLLLTKIKNKDEYTAEHCINVSILSAAFAKHLGLLEGGNPHFGTVWSASRCRQDAH